MSMEEKSALKIRGGVSPSSGEGGGVSSSKIQEKHVLQKRKN